MAAPDLAQLVSLFYKRPQDLGQFEAAGASELPPEYAALLHHDQHMTVTVEQYHQSPVDLRVLEERPGPRHYARKIALTRRTDGRVVQFGIMWIDLSQLPQNVQDEIRRRGEPLGRILIRSNVWREVQLDTLWRVTPGRDLVELFGKPQTTYGRTALIYCNGAPAVELLEIVAPCSPS
jgi:chorismate-pyruvate lyase